MAKWKIVVITDNNWFSYETDCDKRKTEIINNEKSKPEVISISVNKIRCYKRK